jgi:INO80 complex subunit C
MDINDPDLLLPSVLPFKKTQLTERYPKGQTRGRHWKHLKQIIQAENYYSYPADEPTYVSIEAPPSMYPPKKYCDITGFEVNLLTSNLLRSVMDSKHYRSDVVCFIFSWVVDAVMQAPYTDPRSKLRYANTEVFKLIRSLPEDTIQGYLALRNAAVVLK